MNRALVAVLCGCLALGASSLAFAGDNDQASITPHLTPFQNRPCNNQPDVTGVEVVKRIDFNGDCDLAPNTAWSVWLLVCNGSDSTGVAGAEFGIDYGLNAYVGQWDLCADQDFKEAGWPDKGTGITVAWDAGNNCQITPAEPFVPRSVVAVLGHLTVFLYGPDIIQITPKPASGLATVADCALDEDSILGFVPPHLGSAGFCAPGYNPCNLPTRVENKTWGSLKKTFSGE